RRLNAGWPGAYLDRRAAGAAGSVGTVVRAPPRYGRRLPRAELRGCHRQRPGPGPRRLRPGRPDEPHGAHPLDGADAVDGAADRPPAVARRLHEARALEPSLAAARWPVTAVAATLELEAEELEPVAQARQRDHLALPRKERAQQPRGDGTANPPQADRIEPGEHHPALGPKHTVHLAQELVGIAGELDDVRQGHQVPRLVAERQLAVVLEQHGGADHAALPGRGGGARQSVEAARHAVVAQGVEFRQGELERDIAEQVGHRMVVAGLLPRSEERRVGKAGA